MSDLVTPKVIKRFNSLEEYKKFRNSIKLNDCSPYIIDLKGFSDNFLLSEYGICEKYVIKLNPRLRSTCGTFDVYKNVAGYWQIDLNKQYIEFMYEFGHLDIIESLIKHELIHMALFLKGKNFNDGDEEFEREIRRCNACSSNETPMVMRGNSVLGAGIYPVYTIDLKDDKGNVVQKISYEHSYEKREFSIGSNVYGKTGTEYMTVNFKTEAVHGYTYIDSLENIGGDWDKYTVSKSNINLCESL